MGLSILDLALGKLREAGFTADTAFPGQDGPVITDTVAAIHLESVDRAGLTVTVGVHIISPGTKGGTACELEALRAAEVLREAGADCTQNGCRYDGDRRVYSVQVLATFTGVTGADSCTIGPGFRVILGSAELKYVRGFTARLKEACRPEYATGEDGPADYSRQKEVWELTLEEHYPAGIPESGDPGVPFTLKIITEGKTESYNGCYWTSVSRQLTREGLVRIRTALSSRKLEV